MSIAEIDARTYRNILTSCISHLIKQGHPRREAINIAHRQMRSAFTCADDSVQSETREDNADARSADWTR
jgi:hypothetical protein